MFYYLIEQILRCFRWVRVQHNVCITHKREKLSEAKLTFSDLNSSNKDFSFAKLGAFLITDI